VNTSLAVVGGAGAVALGILALAGAPASALALPAAGLLYVTLLATGGEIAIGGALNQVADDAKALVQDGVNRLADMEKEYLITATGSGVLQKIGINPEKFEAMAQIAFGALSLRSAFVKAPPFLAGGTTPSGYALGVSTSGTGTGKVVSFPDTILCGAGAAACSVTYPSGTLVTLFPSPSTGSRFVGWSGACAGTGPCTVTMTAAKSVAARFDPISAIETWTGTFTGNIVATDPCGVCPGTIGEWNLGGTVLVKAAPGLATGATLVTIEASSTGTGTATARLQPANCSQDYVCTIINGPFTFTFGPTATVSGNTVTFTVNYEDAQTTATATISGNSMLGSFQFSDVDVLITVSFTVSK
jgi:hypothetical protein